MSSSEREETEHEADASVIRGLSEPHSGASSDTDTHLGKGYSLTAALGRMIHFGSDSKRQTLKTSKKHERAKLAMAPANDAAQGACMDTSPQRLKQISGHSKEALEEPLSSSSSASESDTHEEEGDSDKHPAAWLSPFSSSDRLSVSSSSDGSDNDDVLCSRTMDHCDILMDGETSSLFGSSDSDSSEKAEKKPNQNTTILSSFSVKHRLQLIRKEFSALKSEFDLHEVDVIGGDDDFMGHQDSDESDSTAGTSASASINHNDADLRLRSSSCVDANADQSAQKQAAQSRSTGTTPSYGLETSIAAMLLSLPAYDDHGWKPNGRRQLASRIPWTVRLEIPYHYPSVRPVVKYASHKGELLPNLKALKREFDSHLSLPVASLRDALVILRQILELKPVPCITPDPLTRATVLVRDYGYPILDARFYGRERDYSIGASELLEYDDEERGANEQDSSGSAGHTSDSLDSLRSWKRKSRLPKDQAVALYAFQPELEGEMGLAEGDPIYILERPGNGWLLASKCNAPELFGYVPENYVKSTKK